MSEEIGTEVSKQMALCHFSIYERQDLVQLGRPNFWRRNGCQYPGVVTAVRDLGWQPASARPSPAAPRSVTWGGFYAELLLLLWMISQCCRMVA